MSNSRPIGQAIHEEPSPLRLDAQVRVPEVGMPVWRCPQAIVRGDLEEAERWDGLS